jgi:hypothetical protein
LGTAQEDLEKKHDIPLPVEQPENLTEDAPAPVDVAEEVSAPLDAHPEPGTAPEEEDTPAPLQFKEETSAGLGAAQEDPEKEHDIPPPVEQPEIVTEDAPAPVEVAKETSAGLDPTPKVEAAQETEDIPAPANEQEVVTPPIEEVEEEEDEEEFLLPVVLIDPKVQAGRALLELTNGYHKPLQLKGVLVTRGTHSIQLLEEAKELPVETTVTLDVTEKLLTLFNP